MPKYIEVQYTDETKAKLRQWCDEEGFDLTFKWSGRRIAPEEFDFHTTILYSTNDIPEFEGNSTIKLEKDGAARIVGFDVFDPNVPVLLIESSYIDNMKMLLMRSGFKDDGRPYRPHVSVSYNQLSNYRDKTPKLPDFELKFRFINIADIL